MYTKALYQRVSGERGGSHRKSRSNFPDLEAWLHDYSGKSPPPGCTDEVGSVITIDPGCEIDGVAEHFAVTSTGTDLPHGTNSHRDLLQDLENDAPQNYDPWNELWPASSIWGENDFLQFASADPPTGYEAGDL